MSRSRTPVLLTAATWPAAGGPAAAQSERPGGLCRSRTSTRPSFDHIFLKVTLTGSPVFGEFALDPVPNGQRFVVELISAEVNGSPGQIPLLSITGDDPRVLYVIPVAKQIAVPGNDIFQGAWSGRLYLDAGKTYLLNFLRDPSGGFATLSVTLSGHLVALP